MNQDRDLAAALADRYRLERELGAGGMARVFLAHDLRHRRQVAIKVLRPELAAAFGVDRFLREIEITANLQHPHILPLHDSGEVAGTIFYVMPYVEGETLRSRIDREHQMSVGDAVHIATAVAGALEYAHQRGVVHRDIKPENILLSGTDALVADFGIGKTLRTPDGEHLTQTGMSIGTPAYMSPEQAMGETIMDGRSDVYSLGVLLYEMLAGTVPFTGPTPMAALARRLSQPPPPLRLARPGVPENVERAVMRALAAEPEKRFSSAREFAAAVQAPAASTTRPALASIAVLPFTNLSAEADNACFADGITEDVIAQLAKVKAMKVISSRSVMALRNREASLQDIGRTLNVATLLEGSVRRAGDRVRIVAQLVDAESDTNLWAETYDRDLTDIFAIQADVALRITSALQAELSPREHGRLVREPTQNLEAYQLYLKGRQSIARFTEEGTRTGIEFLEQAVSRDPDYALAYAALAQAYVEVGGQGALPQGHEEAVRRARRAVDRALHLDSDLGAAYCAQGYLKFTCDFDWEGAERAFARAIELDPGSADAYDLQGQMFWALERHDEALAAVRKAQELDPLLHRTDLATGLLRAGRHADAVAVAEPVILFDPFYPRAHSVLAWAYLLSGRHAEGIASLRRAVALAPGETLFLAQLGQAYGVVGEVDEARAVVKELEALARERAVSPYHLAYAYMGVGDHDRVLSLLERAYAEHAGAIYGIKGSFLFAPLRGHPRFIALLRRMNLA